MKFFCAILLLVGAAVAQQQQDNVRALAESLEKRGEALIDGVRKQLDTLYQNNQTHLANQLDHQLVEVEALVMSLKNQLADKTKEFKIHVVNVLEEDLLHIENSIIDELAVIKQVTDNPKPVDPVKPQPVKSELVVKGEALIKTAQEALGHHKNTAEGRAIEREITALQVLIKEINAKPAAAELKKDEESLTRHEKTLQYLLEKAANRGH